MCLGPRARARRHSKRENASDGVTGRRKEPWVPGQKKLGLPEWRKGKERRQEESCGHDRGASMRAPT